MKGSFAPIPLYAAETRVKQDSAFLSDAFGRLFSRLGCPTLWESSPEHACVDPNEKSVDTYLFTGEKQSTVEDSEGTIRRFICKGQLLVHFLCSNLCSRDDEKDKMRLSVTRELRYSETRKIQWNDCSLRVCSIETRDGNGRDRSLKTTIRSCQLILVICSSPYWYIFRAQQALQKMQVE